MEIKEYLDKAIRDDKTVIIEYIKYGGEYSKRKISEIQYSEEFGEDYIDAFCYKRGEKRTFKISRIQSIDGITNAISDDNITTYRKITDDNVVVNKEPTCYSKTPSPKNEGCYIATMVYGDYEHPQVLILRKYRDDVLLKSYIGRLFVKVYYLTSPKFVRLLRNHKRINILIRSLLNRYIHLINNWN